MKALVLILRFVEALVDLQKLKLEEVLKLSCLIYLTLDMLFHEVKLIVAEENLVFFLKQYPLVKKLEYVCDLSEELVLIDHAVELKKDGFLLLLVELLHFGVLD